MTTGSTLPVLLVGTFFSASGGSRSICEELAARLPLEGCSVVTTSSKRAKLARLLDMVGTAWRRRHEYDIAQVDVFSGPAFFWAEAVCAALALTGKPYVLTLHGGNLPPFAERHPARVGRLLRSAAAVTTPSRYLLESLGRYRSDIRFIPNGLDVGRYAPRGRDRVGPRLVWLRAFHRIYNPTLAVRILPALVQRFPELRLSMIGPDKGDGSLEATQRLASELGVARHVEFRGGIPKLDVPEALRIADIFLNTTNIDSAPVTVLEAMACGLCVVSTNVGGVPYLVEHEQEGLLVPPDDAAAMAYAIGRVLDDRELADRLSANARRKAEQYDWAPIIGTWRRLLFATVERAA